MPVSPGTQGTLPSSSVLFIRGASGLHQALFWGLGGEDSEQSPPPVPVLAGRQTDKSERLVESKALRETWNTAGERCWQAEGTG